MEQIMLAQKTFSLTFQVSPSIYTKKLLQVSNANSILTLHIVSHKSAEIFAKKWLGSNIVINYQHASKQ